MQVSRIAFLFLTSFVSMLLTFWVYFKILEIAKSKNLVDNPDARKLQKRPVPVMGGIAVFFGVICGILFASCVYDCDAILPIILAMSMMLYVGAIDDIIDLSPRNRFIIEILAVLGIIFSDGACIAYKHLGGLAQDVVYQEGNQGSSEHKGEHSIGIVVRAIQGDAKH